jgi:hypothetical protein
MLDAKQHELKKNEHAQLHGDIAPSFSAQFFGNGFDQQPA